MNGGGSLLHPQAPGLHPSDVPFEPSSEREIESPSLVLDN
jgi:hypothetical protein